MTVNTLNLKLPVIWFLLTITLFIYAYLGG
jgi:hypothetical protein